MANTENGVRGKLLNVTKTVYVNILACVRVKGCEIECFRIDSGVRQVCIMSYCIYGPSDEGVENGDREKGSEISRGGKRVEIA